MRYHATAEGNVPFTAEEEAEWDANEFAELAAKPAKEQAALIDAITNAAQSRLDTFASTRGYDGILSATTYASSTALKFAQEGQDAVNLRDSTWAALYAIMAEVTAGTRPMPTGFADIEPDLPILAWTA